MGRLGRLTVAVVADVLDRLGLRSQVLAHTVRPVVPPARLAGRAFPIRATPDGAVLENPYEREIAAVDTVPRGAVVVIATAGCCEAAVWGELLATRALARGAVGAVSDGAVRDLAGLRRLGLPTFAAGVCARDSWGRLLVTGFGEEVVCAGVTVGPGDLVLGDLDGVVVVPAAVASRVLTAAEEKLGKEGSALEELGAGVSVTDVYDRHGIL